MRTATMAPEGSHSMHPRVLILGYAEAAMLLRRHESAGDVRAILAIHGRREFPVETDGVPHSLVLRFDDTEAPSATDPLHAARVRIRQRDAADNGLILVPPTLDHARAIIQFAQALRDLDGILLCHCMAGVSRSTAAALLCLATWTGPGRERYCIEHVLAVRPCAVPHADLVAFGDQLLQRDGNLMEAVRSTVRI